jgi:hypothetical protein
MEQSSRPFGLSLSDGLGSDGGGRDYARMLQEGHAETNSFNGGEPASRLAYLSSHIFEFTTYDGKLAEEFARKALEVCRAISERKTFEYIADPANYRWFLLMCNMPFFSLRLNWGTSIRGAWWDTSTPNATELDSCGLWLEGGQLTRPLKFSTEQWHEFIAALLEFGVEEPNTK